MQQQDTQTSIAAVIALVIGIGVAALLLIFVGVLGGQTYTLVESDIDAIYATSAERNESFTANLTLWAQLDHNEILNGTVGVNSFNWTVRNASSGSNSFNIITSNFSLNLTTGMIRLHEATDALDEDTCYIYYNYRNRTIREHMRSSILSGFFALRTTGNYLPIIVLAVIIVVILGLIVGLTTTTGIMGGNKGYSGGAL